MQEYRIIIGIGEDRNGRQIGASEAYHARNQARKLLTNRFNGYTEYQHTGGWVDNHGELITEKGVTFSIFSDLGAQARVVADQIAHLFNQQSVILIHPNGDVEFIEPEYETKADDAVPGYTHPEWVPIEDEPLEDVLQGTYDDTEVAYTDGRDTFSGH